MNESVNEEIKEVRRIHQEEAEQLAYRDAEIRKNARGLAESRVAYRRNPSDETKSKLDRAQVEFNNAAIMLPEAHDEYARNIAEGNEHYEDNSDTYHGQAVREVVAEGKTIKFGGVVAQNVKVKNPE